MRNSIKKIIKESIDTKTRILKSEHLLKNIYIWINKTVEVIRAGNKVMFFGNGGSASDSQHLACEFVVRFKKDRRPLPAIAFTTDTSILTATSNDYSFKDIFVRQLKALGKKGDMAVGISTSGNSLNVYLALKEAKKMGIFTVGLTGKGGGKIGKIVDLLIDIPSKSTARIQESHILVGHLLCELVEEKL